MTVNSATYVEVSVAKYRLALPTVCVAGVLTDVLVNERAPFRGERLPFVDLAAIFAGQRRLVVPFAIAVESRGQRALVGVDVIAYQKLTATTQPVPKLGLLRPELFEGALRKGGELVLVLAPRSLVTL